MLALRVTNVQKSQRKEDYYQTCVKLLFQGLKTSHRFRCVIKIWTCNIKQADSSALYQMCGWGNKVEEHSGKIQNVTLNVSQAPFWWSLLYRHVSGSLFQVLAALPANSEGEGCLLNITASYIDNAFFKGWGVFFISHSSSKWKHVVFKGSLTCGGTDLFTFCQSVSSCRWGAK